MCLGESGSRDVGAQGWGSKHILVGVLCLKMIFWDERRYETSPIRVVIHKFWVDFFKHLKIRKSWSFRCWFFFRDLCRGIFSQEVQVDL